MKVIILHPKKMVLAGLLSAILMGVAVFGAVTLAGVLGPKPATAQEIAPGEMMPTPEPPGANVWHFAEGYTGPGFEEWLLVYIMGCAVYPEIEINFKGDGLCEEYVHPLPPDPSRRVTLNVNEILRDNYGYEGNISMSVRVRNSEELSGGYHETIPSVCERSMYWDYNGQWTGGSTSLGYPHNYR